MSYPMPDRQTFVYIIQETCGDALKIGVAAQPEIRLSGIQTGNPRDLALVHQVAFKSKVIAHQVEYRAHKSLADWRCNGEWFAVPLSEAIDAIRAASNFVTNYTPMAPTHLRQHRCLGMKYDS